MVRLAGLIEGSVVSGGSLSLQLLLSALTLDKPPVFSRPLFSCVSNEAVIICSPPTLGLWEYPAREVAVTEDVGGWEAGAHGSVGRWAFEMLPGFFLRGSPKNWALPLYSLVIGPPLR